MRIVRWSIGGLRRVCGVGEDRRIKRILIAILALSSLLVAAAPAAAASRGAAALPRDLGPGVSGQTHSKTGAVRFIGPSAGRPITRPAGVGADAPPREAA